MSEDDEITVRLSLKEWRVVVAHVEGGIYRDVQPLLARMYAQVNAVITAANERAGATAIEDERRAREALDEAHTDVAADESTESQSSGQMVLH